MREKSKKVCHLATGQVVCPLVVNARYMGCPKMEVIMGLEYGQTAEHLACKWVMCMQ
jgi:hypothetical protein